VYYLLRRGFCSGFEREERRGEKNNVGSGGGEEVLFVGGTRCGAQGRRLAQAGVHGGYGLEKKRGFLERGELEGRSAAVPFDH